MLRLLVLGFVLLIAGPAAAVPVEPAAPVAPAAPAAPPSAAPAGEEQYLDYRWSLVAVDGAALATLVSAAFVDENASLALAVAGISVYALGPGVVHLAHGQPVRAAGSAGLRIGLPAIGVGVGAALAAGCEKPSVNEYGETEGNAFCPAGAAIFGGLIAGIGALTAALIDDVALGKVKLKQEVTSGSTWGVVPLISPRRSALGVSLVGAF
jgi:hypothetical protein